MSTANKLTYLNTTKGKIKDAINLAGANLTNEPFRAYSTKLYQQYLDILKNGTSSLYANMPKVTGTGSELSLKNTAEAPMVLELSASESTQKTTSGKNLFDFIGAYRNNYADTRVENGVTYTVKAAEGKINMSGTMTARTHVDLLGIWDNTEILIPLDSTKTYTISTNFLYRSITVRYKDSSDTLQSIFMEAAPSKTILNAKGITFIQMDIQDINTTYNLDLYIQLEEGPATNYEKYTGGSASPNPSFPQDMNMVTGENSVKIQNKNLFDKTTCVNGAIEYSTGNIVTTTLWKTSDFIPISPSENYIYSGVTFAGNNVGFQYYDANKILIRTDKLKTRANILENIPLNSKYIKFTVANGADNIFDLNTFQFERKSIATSYAGHKEQIFPLWLAPNIFDKTNPNVLSNLFINLSNNTIESSGATKSFYVSCQPNSNYVISKKISARFVVGTSSSIPALNTVCNNVVYNNSASNLKITTGANDNYLVVFYFNSNYDTASNVEEEIRNSIYVYEEGTGLELAKIGEYADKIFNNVPSNPLYDANLVEGGWYKYEIIGKYTFNGTEGLYLQNNGKRVYVSYLNNLGAFEKPIPWTNISVKSGLLLSNRLKEVTAGNTWNGIQGISYDQEPGFDISINGLSTLEDYQNFFANNDFTVCYLYENPTKEQITDTTLVSQLESIKNAMSYDDETNISQTNANRPFIISAAAIKNSME